MIVAALVVADRRVGWRRDGLAFIA